MLWKVGCKDYSYGREKSLGNGVLWYKFPKDSQSNKFSLIVLGGQDGGGCQMFLHFLEQK